MERLTIADKKLIVFLWIMSCFQNITADRSQPYVGRVDYEVEGNGFHRLGYVKLPDGYTLVARLHFDASQKFDLPCYVALQLSPDPTLYVNVDELADLGRYGETVACSEGEINVELFGENAKPQNITICTKYKKPAVFMNLPLHQRYRLPEEDGTYINVTLPDPVLLVGCTGWSGDAEVHICNSCAYPDVHWRKFTFSGPKSKYTWTVAVGNLSHANFVSIVTIALVWLGTIVILRTLWRSRRTDGEKRD